MMVEQKCTIIQPLAPQIVNTPEALQALAQTLSCAPRLAVDTESNSLFAYRERVCLIQISIPGRDYVIDPLSVADLSPLAPLFETDRIEKVFHAADYDLIVLQRDYGFTCNGLFDTMWGARILGWPRVGLGDILKEYFGIQVNKKFQRHDWGQRPLDSEALTYAMMDTHLLLALRDLQQQALEKAGRWEEAQEVFAYLSQNISVNHDTDPGAHFWRIKGVHDLPRKEQAALYALYLWRKAAAERLDRPTMKVISNARLLTLAHVQPRTKAALVAAGLTPHQIRRFGSGILQALRADPPALPPYPEHTPAPESVIERYNALKSWRKTVAARRGVDSDVILPNATLWELAQHPPRDLEGLLGVPGIGPWRKNAYGPELLRVLNA